MVCTPAEQDGDDLGYAVSLGEKRGRIHADLTVGADVASCQALKANSDIAGMGMALHGQGFVLTPDEADELRPRGGAVIKPFLGARDLVQQRRERYVIDFSDLSEQEALTSNAAAFQRVLDRVRPERVVNARKSIREQWWRFGWERPVLRRALEGLDRRQRSWYNKTRCFDPFPFPDADTAHRPVSGRWARRSTSTGNGSLLSIRVSR